MIKENYMAKLLYTILILFGLVLTSFCGSFMQGKIQYELTYPMIGNDIYAKMIYIEEGNLEDNQFNILLNEVATDYDLEMVFEPNYSPLFSKATDKVRYKVHYYVSSSGMINQFFKGGSEGGCTYTTFMQDDTCRIDTIKPTRHFVFIPIDAILDHQSSSAGLLWIIHPTSMEEVDKGVQKVTENLGVPVHNVYSTQEIDYQKTRVNRAMASIDLNYQFIYLALFGMILICFIYTMMQTRKKAVIKKTMGYSAIEIIKDLIKSHLVLPIVISFFCFLLYMAILGYNFNRYAWDIFKIYSLGYLLLVGLLFVGMIGIYYSITRVSNVEILKGRTQNSYLNTTAYFLKFAIMPILIVSAFVVFNTSDHTQFYAQKRNYYIEHQANYQLLSVSGTSIYSLNDMDFYERFFNALDDDAFFGVGLPLYHPDYVATQIETRSYMSYRIDVGPSFMRMFEIETLDSKPVVISPSDPPTVYISDNFKLNDKQLQELSVFNEIVIVKAKPLPNLYNYLQNYQSVLDKFILWYDGHYMIADNEQILVDINKIDETTINKRIEEACQKLGIQNVFSFKPLETAVDFSYRTANAQNKKQWSGMLPVLVVYMIISLLVCVIYFNENKRKIVIQNFHGYSKLVIYRPILLVNLLFVLLSLMITVFFDTQLLYLVSKNSYLVSSIGLDYLLLFSIALVIIDTCIVIVNMRYLEKRALIESKKS